MKMNFFYISHLDRVSLKLKNLLHTIVISFFKTKESFHLKWYNCYEEQEKIGSEVTL